MAGQSRNSSAEAYAKQHKSIIQAVRKMYPLYFMSSKAIMIQMIH